MLSDRHQHLIRTEIEFERRLAAIRSLSAFRRNPTTWELLMLLVAAGDGFTDGLHEVPNATVTRYLGSSALLKFVREQRDAGYIRFLEHEKRSRRVLQIDPQIVQELIALLNWRDRALAQSAAGHTGTDGLAPHPETRADRPVNAPRGAPGVLPDS